MSFAEPTHLLALLALPLLLVVSVAARARRRRFAVRHPAAAAMRALAPRSARWRRVVPATLLGASTIALAAGFAKPQRTVHVPVEKASVVLVTDESGSMQADDVSPTRLQAAQGAARSFLSDAPKSLLIGFAGFSSSVETNVAPTTDRAAVTSAIGALSAEGGTATGDALSAALDQLAARKGTDGRTAPAAIVLLSDGARTAGSDPLEAAARAKRLGIPIYTVALGTQSGTLSLPDGQTLDVPPDPQTLAQIASTSGGRTYAVDDADTLSGIYRSLGSKLGTKAEQREVTIAFVGGGLLLLLGGLGTSVGTRGRLAL
ncbi:VWA domain-containing protein [Conexibacter woesei]|uniref:VWA domain-containing protein n=1 Tax=Conexibacter woesei TaxID=191495 RepID=UPI00040BB6D2|nr:VWA domain-containing protein [Conexibacter woesei]